VICCVIVLRLLGWIYERCGFAPGTSGTRTAKLPIPVWLLIMLAAIEIGMGIALLRMLGNAGQAGQMHHGHGRMEQAAPAPHWHVVAAVAAVTVVGGLACAVVRDRRIHVASAGLTLTAFMAGLSQSGLMQSSHLVVMAVLESLTVVTPLCLVGLGWNGGQADDVWVIGRAAIAIAAAAAVVTVILSAHAHSTDRATWLGAHWWSGATALAAGTAFWAGVLRFRLPQLLRFVLIGFVLEAGSLLALAMLLSTVSMDSAGLLGMSPLADQRLAGLLMMLVDGALVASWLRASRGRLPRRLRARTTA